jgi:hypothetical protein
MSRVVKISVSGTAPDTDAPLVEDALDEIRDVVEILRDVEAAAAGTSATAIAWRMTNASKSSPLAFEIQAFPKHFATNIDQRVDIVLTETARGLASLQARPERPRHFTDDVMKRVRRVLERVTNGLGVAAVDFGVGLPPVRITATVAKIAARNVDLIMDSPDKPYKELGSIEGYLQGVERDGFGRAIAHVIERVTGQTVKCVVDGLALPELETKEIRDILRNRRVQVAGLIHFVGLGKIDRIEARGLRFMQSKSDLPQIDDIMDPDFTGGMRSEEYLERLRDGTLS